MPRTPALSYEYVYNYFKEQGCELLSKEYKNNHTFLDYLCSCGNPIPNRIRFSHFKKGIRCKKCQKERHNEKVKNNSFKSSREIQTYDFVKDFFMKRNCILISKNFTNDRQILQFECSCGNHDTITFGAFKRGFLCHNCSGNYSSKNKKYCIEFVAYYLECFGMKLISTEYVAANSSIDYICSCGNPNRSTFGSITEGYRCHKCSKITRTAKNSHLWEGGITDLTNYIRDNILRDWKKSSIEECNYKCVLTGGRFDDVHHLYSLNKITREALAILNLPVKSIINEVGSYSVDELQSITEKIIELHNKYGLGVCLNRRLHNLFHNEYGFDNNKNQFKKFTQRLYSGEFDNYLKENNLELLIN